MGTCIHRFQGDPLSARGGLGDGCSANTPSPLPPLQCSFALVQYGRVIQTEFNLQDSQNMTASLAKVQNITQVRNVTRTASAIQHVL